MATVTSKRTDEVASRCLALASDMLRLPSRHIWVDYDEDADVLYLSFRRPQRATKTIELADDVILRKRGREIVGVTILNASARK